MTLAYYNKSLDILEMEKHSLFDVTMAGVIVLIFGIAAVNYKYLSSLSIEEFNKVPLYLLAYHRSMLTPSVTMICVFVAFLRKENFRTIVWNELKKTIFG